MANRKWRRATAAERRRLGLDKGDRIQEIDLTDPQEPARFICEIKGKLAALDELVGRYYRHRGECNIPGCDCGLTVLAEQVENACSYVSLIKDGFGEIIIDSYPYIARFVKEFGGDDTYAALTGNPTGAAS
jgi:hypothetical protein